MENFLSEMNVEDRNRSYSDSYVLATLQGRKRAVYVVEFHSSENTVFVKDMLGKHHELPLSAIDTELPDCGMIWHRGELMYVAKLPQRQWKRGLTSKQLAVYLLSQEGTAYPNGCSTSTLRSVIATVFENTIQHPNVLSRDFGRRGKYLFFRSLPVGVFQKNVCDLYTPISNPPEIEGIEYVYHYK